MSNHGKVDVNALADRIMADEISTAEMHGEGVAQSINGVLEQLREYKKGAAFWRTAYHELQEVKDSELEAAQLHIKELREFISTAQVSSGVCCCGGSMDHDCYSSGHAPVDMWDNAVANLLAKQPDTRALEKALLEAELNGLESPTDTVKRICELKAKLAELNKEI